MEELSSIMVHRMQSSGMNRYGASDHHGARGFTSHRKSSVMQCAIYRCNWRSEKVWHELHIERCHRHPGIWRNVF